MVELYHAPNTRSLRVRWLLEELGLRYRLRRVAFRPPARSFFRQDTPSDTFSAADVMMGFTLVAARMLGVLDARFPRLLTCVERLQTRPALKRALED